MRLSDFDNLKKKKFQPKPIARYWGGPNGTRVPDDLKPFFNKHVKQAKNGSYYVNQYPDKWYFDVFHKNPNIKDFDSFFAVIKPYFAVQRIQEQP